jgi:hypothetical protein
MDYQGHYEDNICPACGKYFKTTQGLLAHLSSARSCSWWKKGNMAKNEYQEQLDTTPQHEDDDMEDNNINIINNNNNDDADNREIPDHGQHLYPDADHIEEPEDIFHFVGIQDLGDEGSNGTGLPRSQTRLPQSRALDDEEDCKVEDVDETAGKVIGQDQKLYDKWKQIFGQGQAKEGFNMNVDDEPSSEKQNPYAPFTSELDWRIARWAIKDNPGHKAFDRLLSIPGVGRS